MKIAILGTRGIPNNYGGFEQFAELLSLFLVKKGHEVCVYNSHNHTYKESVYQGVRIIHKFDPENIIGTAGQFIYDCNCILDSRHRNFDIILQLGYTSSSIWSFLFPKDAVLITNMDGLEWKRDKFSPLVKRFLKFAQSLAVKKSHYLISDSKGIKDYLQEIYSVDSHYIAYGTEIFKNYNEDILKKFSLHKYTYNLVIARIEPENNIELIIKEVLSSPTKESLVIVGDYSRNSYGRRLFKSYGKYNKVRFLGSLYDKVSLNNLRYFSSVYFHGHSVGGTNPSLLEAMGCSCLIVAHDNQFNRAVLDDQAYYFKKPLDIKNIIAQLNRKEEVKKIENNLEKIRDYYNSNNINTLYEKLFFECLEETRHKLQ